MKNKILLILCLMGVMPMFASAPAQQKAKEDMARALRKARDPRNQEKKQEQKPAVAQEGQKDEEDCMICLDKLHKEGIPTKTLHCGAQSRNPKAGEHTFHTACINEWLTRDPSCPVCRTAVPQNEISQILLDKQEKKQQKLMNSQQIIENLLKRAHRKDNVTMRRDAQLKLGNIYSAGSDGIAPDFVQADKFYSLARKEGAPSWVQRRAELGQGNIYRLGGYGIEQNFNKAVYFYEQAIKADDIAVKTEAQLGLAKIYRDGSNDVPRNLDRAKYFFNEIAVKGKFVGIPSVLGLEAQSELRKMNQKQEECVIQ